MGTYTNPANITGFSGMIEYIADTTAPVLGPLGSNMVAILIIAPLFTIVLFGLLARGERPIRAF